MSIPAYADYIDSGVTWLGKVPSHWSLRRIGGLFIERREKVNDTDYPALSVTKNGIVPQLDTAAKTDDGDNRKCVLAGDFVINSRSDRKGSSGLSSHNGSVSLINTVLTPNKCLDGNFVHYLLRSASFQEEYYRYGKGIVADLWSTNYSEMKNILLAFPARHEQSSIAAFLDRETAKIDALVEEQLRLISLLKEKKQAVFSHAVTKGLDPDALIKDSGVDWIGEVPMHWEVSPLKHVTEAYCDGPFGAGLKSDHYTAAGVRVIRLQNIKSYRFDGTDEAYIDDKYFDEHLSRHEVFEGDLLIAGLGDDRNTVGRCCVAPRSNGRMMVKADCFRFRLDRTNNSSNFVAYQLSAGSSYSAGMLSSGSTRSRINLSTMADIIVALPTLSEQRRIAERLEVSAIQFEGLMAEAGCSVVLLRERRAALISAAVTGKIDVRQRAEVLAFPISRARARGLIAVEIIERSLHQATFGRVKLQKIAFLAEAHVGVAELAGSYRREAAGPLDRAMISEMEDNARAIAGVVVDQSGGIGTTVVYRAGLPRGLHRQELADWLGVDRSVKLDKLIEDFTDLNTKAAEAVSTLYGVWNDALISGVSPSDGEIISGFLNDWHPEKRVKFRAEELPNWLDWMRRHSIVPTGSGPETMTERLFT